MEKDKILRKFGMYQFLPKVVPKGTSNTFFVNELSGRIIESDTFRWKLKHLLSLFGLNVGFYNPITLSSIQNLLLVPLGTAFETPRKFYLSPICSFTKILKELTQLKKLFLVKTRSSQIIKSDFFPRELEKLLF